VTRRVVVADDFELDTQTLGALPVVNAFIERLGACVGNCFAR
jgi:hypothetical protein